MDPFPTGARAAREEPAHGPGRAGTPRGPAPVAPTRAPTGVVSPRPDPDPHIAAEQGLPAQGPDDGHRADSEPPGTDTAERLPARAPQGRNVPAAIGVGLAMGVAVVAALFIRREVFVVLMAATVLVALWELANAFRARKVRIPLLPIALGGVGMLAAAYVSGPGAHVVALGITVLAVLWWRVLEGERNSVRDVTAGVFTAVYVPYLAGFGALMLAADDGAFRVMAFLIVTVASDVGGYAVGALWGRHVLAPTVSPRKSWEGVIGSAALAGVTGALAVAFLLSGPWWAGLVLGAAVTVAATIGDLSESLLKRDLGIKDMGSLLPGHGGIMDRLDSLLPAAPVAYVVLEVLVG